MMSDAILAWWMALGTVACVNIGVWTYTVRWLARQKYLFDPAVYRHRQWFLWLSSVYVFVCAFRSFLPRVDVLRICLVDSWLSSIFLGRTIATIAEIAFMVELCLMAYLLGRWLHVRGSIRVVVLVILLIVIAEGFSWLAVLTTNNLGHVIENALWTLASIILVAFLAILRPRTMAGMQLLLTWMMIFGMSYIAYMLMANVPMYASRWQHGLIEGKEYLSLSHGLHEILHLRTVTFDWNIWRDDIGWQTLYFSTAVWLSMALVYVQPFETIEYDSEQQSALSIPKPG